jgi:hypothetical protein
MKILIIANTNLKQSCEDGDIFWNKEYALGTFESVQDIDDYYEEHPIRDILKYSNPVLGLRRRVDYKRGVESPREWEVITVQCSESMAALDIGDTDYYEGNSLAQIHARVVSYCDRLNAWRDELQKLQDEITPHKFQSMSNIAKRYQEQFDLELKKKRIYSAAKDGTASQDVVDEIKKPIALAYETEKMEINNKIAELEQMIQNLKFEDC